MKPLFFTVSILLAAQFLCASSLKAQESKNEDVRVHVYATGPSYRPQEWVTLGLRCENRTAKPVDIVVSLTIEDGQMQYQRKLWIPGNTQRVSWLPVRMPDFDPGGDLPRSSIAIRYVLLVSQDGKTYQRVKQASALDESMLIAVSTR